MSKRDNRRRPAPAPRKIADRANLADLPARRSSLLPFPATKRTRTELDWLRECQQASQQARAYELNAAVRVLAAGVREIDHTAVEALFVRVEGTDELALLEVTRRDGHIVTETPAANGSTHRSDLVDEVAASVRSTDADTAMWLFRCETQDGWVLDVEGALGGPSPNASAIAA